MAFTASWHTLLEEIDALPEGARLVTPLSHREFRITDTQEHRILVEFVDRDETRPLQRDQFETLYRRVLGESDEAFDLERLPPDADPYPAVWSLHPRFEVDEDAGVLRQSEDVTDTQVYATDSEEPSAESTERHEPDLQVYSDALLALDALERQDMTDLTAVETDALVTLYTLLSDLQRSANDLRKDLADVLLDRLHHDQTVSGQFGSVQRTSRRNRSLKDHEVVLNALEAAGIDRWSSVSRNVW